MSKLLKRLSRILEHPGVLKAKYIYGIHPHIAFYFLTLKDFYPEINTFIDVGCNDGSLIKGCNHFYPEAFTVAFEPFKERFDYCSENFKNIALYNVALWNKNEERTFHENKIFDGVSSLKERTELHRDTFNVPFDEEEKKVDVVRFDSLNIGIEKPCLLKIDVEGSEFEVLDGFGDRLNEVDVVLMEYMFEDFYKEQKPLSEIMALLEKHGFKKFIQKSNHINGSGILYCDLMFFRSTK